MRPTVLVQLSDTHLREGDHEPAAGLERCVRRVLELEPRPVAVVVTGDIADAGRPSEYARARELLAPLTTPVHVLPGNHDDRAGLRAEFGLDGAPEDPIAYAVQAGPLRLVVADTTIPGHADGRLELEWLRARLEEDRTTPTVLAMHHAPLMVGMSAMDDIGLPADTRAGLAQLLRSSPQVKRLITGHTHRPSAGEIGGCGVLMAPSTSFALRPDFVGDKLDVVSEMPAIAVHVYVDGQIVSHILPVF